LLLVAFLWVSLSDPAPKKSNLVGNYEIITFTKSAFQDPSKVTKIFFTSLSFALCALINCIIELWIP
jgi:hypothetical protein